MKKKKKWLESSQPQQSESQDDFFAKVSIPFKESKEEIWTKLESKLVEVPQTAVKSRVISLSWYRRLAAAVLLVVGITFLLKNYTTTIVCQLGEQQAVVLPDGSTVNLNANSQLTYHPFWWNFDRRLTFEGEAFFSVEKGKRFQVISVNGITEVLGTSFNIFARKARYEVYCKTGKVRVTQRTTEESVNLLPNQMAFFSGKEILTKQAVTAEKRQPFWQQDNFDFSGTPLSEVLPQLEIQYGVRIVSMVDNRLTYGGHFPKPLKVETALEIICEGLGLKFKETAMGEYELY
ncbi:MAG: FecR domain-containing protein [Bacteroidota bacterium]